MLTFTDSSATRSPDAVSSRIPCTRISVGYSNPVSNTDPSGRDPGYTDCGGVFGLCPQPEFGDEWECNGINPLPPFLKTPGVKCEYPFSDPPSAPKAVPPGMTDEGFIVGAMTNIGLAFFSYSYGQEEIYDLLDFEYAEFDTYGISLTMDFACWGVFEYYGFMSGFINYSTGGVARYAGGSVGASTAGATNHAAPINAVNATGFVSVDGNITGVTFAIGRSGSVSITGGTASMFTYGASLNFVKAIRTSKPTLFHKIGQPPTSAEAEQFINFINSKEMGPFRYPKARLLQQYGKINALGKDLLGITAVTNSNSFTILNTAAMIALFDMTPSSHHCGVH